MPDTYEPIASTAASIEETTTSTANSNETTTTTTPSSKDMPPPKKRKRSTPQETPIKASIAPQTTVALPPPLMTYPHPHLMPPYYPIYQHPYYLAVGQPPISPSLSPTLSSSSTSTAPSTSATKPNATVRILPKSPTSTPSTQPANQSSTSPSALPPSYIYPYAIQVSPQLHPSAPIPPPTSGSPVAFHPLGVPVRHNSISSTTTSTADEREQARKVSHSAIERRRREKINDKILQLRDLIPACSERENLHKMTILQSAIDYIVYLKTTIEDLESDKKTEKFIPTATQQQTKPMLPKEVEPFTHQFSLNEDEEEDTAWCPKSIPSSSLKPMDVIQLNKSKKKSPSSSPPPKIVVDNETADRNMNLENILC